MALYTEDSFTTEINTNWARISKDLPTWHLLHPSRHTAADKYQETKDTTIQNAWAIYKNALNSNLKEMLLGDVKLRSEISILQNFGTTAGTTTTMDRGILRDGSNNKVTTQMVTKTIDTQNLAISEAVRHGEEARKFIIPTTGSEMLYKGSVLNDGFWWPLINDAWVLGAVHGLRVFHLALAEVDPALLWDASNNRPRVLGRELIGLVTAGYSLIGLPSWAKTKPDPKLGASTLSTASTTGAAATQKEIRTAYGWTFSPTSKTKAQNLTFTSYHAAIDSFNSLGKLTAIFSSEITYDDYNYADRTQ